MTHSLGPFRILSCVFLLATLAPLFSQTLIADDTFSTLGPWKPVSGTWVITRDEKLSQIDPIETMAMITRPIRQHGIVGFSFALTVRDGFTDQYGGFGIHVGVNRRYQR